VRPPVAANYRAQRSVKRVASPAPGEFVPTRLLILAAAVLAAIAVPSARSAFAPAAADTSDLDTFMSQVITRRDDNWKKLQQYVLDENERFLATGTGGQRVFGSERQYTWFPQDGFFVRSPVKADGVTISESERRKAEQEWIDRERRREEFLRKRQQERKGKPPENDDVQVKADDNGADVPSLDDVVRSAGEPKFVSSAYFMRFRFDPGHYALVGREKLLDRDVLKIEYYPTKLFQEGRTRPAKEVRERDDEIEKKMNKSSIVTLWVEPTEHQILQYEFRNIDFDFMPARYLVRLDQLRASMRMAQPFPGVWLPDTISMRFGMTLAIGSINAEYDVHYHDYRLADVKTRVR
jgi:hypothetical protein